MMFTPLVSLEYRWQSFRERIRPVMWNIRSRLDARHAARVRMPSRGLVCRPALLVGVAECEARPPPGDVLSTNDDRTPASPPHALLGRPLGVVLMLLGHVLCPFGVVLVLFRRMTVLVGHLVRLLSVLPMLFGSLLGPFGVVLVLLGSLLGPFGVVLVLLGSLLGPFGVVLVLLGGVLRRSAWCWCCSAVCLRLFRVLAMLVSGLVCLLRTVAMVLRLLVVR